MAIPDMFVGDRMHPDSTYRQNLIKRFLAFLISEEYTREWGLLYELGVTISVLDSDHHDLKQMTSTEASSFSMRPHSSNLGKILHCEQVVLFKMLTDAEILNQLVDGLISKMHTSEIGFFFENNPQITLDIVTYNDMCSKCFATCYNMQQRLQSSVNALLFDKLDRLHIFPTSFPVPVTILISSFRPFKLDDCHYTRGIKGDFDNLIQYHTEYKFALPPQQSVSIGQKRVLQVFNPWIEGGMTASSAATICKAAMELQQSLEEYSAAKAKQDRHQSLNSREKSILTSITHLERYINGFIRDFRFCYGLQNPVEHIEYVIRVIEPITVMLPQYIEKLNKLKIFVADATHFLNKINDTEEMKVDDFHRILGFAIDASLIDASLPEGLVNDCKIRSIELIEKRFERHVWDAKKSEFISQLEQIWNCK